MMLTRRIPIPFSSLRPTRTLPHTLPHTLTHTLPHTHTRHYQTFQFQDPSDDPHSPTPPLTHTHTHTPINFNTVIQSQQDIDTISIDTINRLDILTSVELLFHTARKHYHLSQSQLDRVAINISRLHVDTHTHGHTFDAQCVSNVMYGLHPYDSTTYHIDSLVTAIAYKVCVCEEEMRSQHIGNVLFGLQGLDSKSSAVRKLIQILAERIDTCTEELSPLDFGNTMYGLRNMSSKYEEVRQLLHVLTSKLESCEESLTSQVIGISLYGISSMSSRHAEVLPILRVLADKIKHSECEMDAVALSGVYGLHKMYSDKEEVRNLVQVLSDKIRESTVENYTPLQLASALFGLQEMISKYDEIRSMVQVLAIKIENNCEGDFSPQTLDLALRGIRAMSSEQPEVRAVIRALAKKLQMNSQCSPHYFVSISSTLSKKSCEYVEVRELYEAFTNEILRNSQQFTMNDVIQICSNLSHMQSAYPEVVNLLKALDTKLKNATPDSLAISPILHSLRHISQHEIWVKDMIVNVTQKVKATDVTNIRARDAMSALSFLSCYSCDSIHIRNLVLNLLDKFSQFPLEDRKHVFISTTNRLDIVSGLVGIGMKNEPFVTAYLQFVHETLVSTLNFDGATIMSQDYLADILQNFQTMKYSENTSSGTQLSEICVFLLSELNGLEESKSDIRHSVGALFGLQGLLGIPPTAGELMGPGAALCTHFISKLKKMLVDDDTEINVFSCQLDMHLTLQRMILFEFVCRNELETLGLADDADFIISKLKVKLDTRASTRKLLRFLPTQLALTKEEKEHVLLKVQDVDTDDVDILYRECLDACFPCLHTIKKNGIGDNETVQGINVEFATRVYSDPHTTYLLQLRDMYLKSRYNLETIRCDDVSEAEGSNRELLITALQDAAVKLLSQGADSEK